MAHPGFSPHPPLSALLTDLYQLTMACGYRRVGVAEREATFHLSFRQQPFRGGFTVAAGLGEVVELLARWRYEPAELAYLRTLAGNDGKPLLDDGCRRATGLGAFLRVRGVTEVHVAGLATDYCVKATALDARQEGFEVHLIENACRGVELHPGDTARALEEMRAAGVRVVTVTKKTFPVKKRDRDDDSELRKILKPGKFL